MLKIRNKIYQIKNQNLEQFLRKYFCSKENQSQQKKYNNGKSVLKKELIENPEFDKAFPHIAKFKPQTTIKRNTDNLDYMESLQYRFRVDMPRNYEDTLMKNYKNYVEGYHSPQGPLKYLSQEEIDRINIQIDQKLQELEATGLSREELLFDDQQPGIPLTIDPFFQFIKNNKDVRQMLLKPGEDYTLEKVIELALRQDIGPDTAFSRPRAETMLEHEISQPLSKRFERGNITDKQRMKPELYYSQSTQQTEITVDAIKDKFKKYHYTPFRRSDYRKKNTKKLNVYDIHWRNNELLCKFLTETSKIKNRYLTLLPDEQQRLVSKVIKHARNLLLLPSTAFLKSTDKKSLTTLQEDLETYSRKAIDVESGQIFYDGKLPEGSDRVQQFLKRIRGEDMNLKEAEKNLRFEFMSQEPVTTGKSLKGAQAYAHKLKEDNLVEQGIDVDILKKEYQKTKQITSLTKLKIDNRLSVYDQINLEDFNAEPNEQDFSEFTQKVEEDGSVSNFFELFFAEKTNDPDLIYHVLDTQDKITQIAEDYANKDINVLFDELEKLKKELNLPKSYQPKQSDHLFNKKFEDNYREKNILEKLSTQGIIQ